MAMERLTSVPVSAERRFCAGCGGAFVPRSFSQRYCEARCRDLAYGLDPDRKRPPFTHSCSRCSEPFVSRRRDARYCSAACRKGALRERQETARGRDGIDDGYATALRGDPCSYCGGPGGGADHIVPLAAGGADDLENLTGACSKCNSSKRDRPLLTWMFARVAPRREHCPICGSSLAARRSDAQTCSPRCRRELWRLRAILAGNGPFESIEALWERRAKAAQAG
jgi:5-methylcytosine-specific restriction endonuclease McrA